MNAHRVVTAIEGDLNVTSLQDTSRSDAKLKSLGGAFGVGPDGGPVSFSSQRGRANGAYAGVGEQSGIQAAAGGFEIEVKGNTDLKGAYIASTAAPSSNRLTTGTLSFSDVLNSSSYSASSSGFAVGGLLGIAPMLSQRESGNESAMTKSAISEGAIVLANRAQQKQDMAALNRDTSNLNGMVGRAPDLQGLLSDQADMMQAAQAAGAAVAKGIGNYAAKKQEEAREAGDIESAEKWAEGGAYRVAMHAAGGALVAGLGGGNAVGGAAGAAASSLMAGKLNEISGAIAGKSPTGNEKIDRALGNIVANVIAGGAGALAGGNSGTAMAANVDLYNRQLHPDERASIERRKESYAKKNGLTVAQADQELLTQANLMVQNGSPAQWNERAAAFLRQERGMLPADGNSGPGYMFYATPDQKANPSMYAGYYANGADLNNPSAAQIDSSVSREQANRNAIGGATIAAAAGGALIVGAPIAAGVGTTAFAVIGSTTGGGMDAAGQYSQTGTIRPAQSLFAAATGAVTAPIGASTGLIRNMLLGGAGAGANTAFNNVFYGDNSSVLFASSVGAAFSGAAYPIGLGFTKMSGQLLPPLVYPNGLNPNVPALFQGGRTPYPVNIGAAAGSLTQGIGSFVPSKAADEKQSR